MKQAFVRASLLTALIGGAFAAVISCSSSSKVSGSAGSAAGGSEAGGAGGTFSLNVGGEAGALVSAGGAGCGDLKTDAKHCGSCATACGAGQACVAGACTCPPYQSFCNGACVPTSVDPANCGKCGTACSGKPTGR